MQQKKNQGLVSMCDRKWNSYLFSCIIELITAVILHIQREYTSVTCSKSQNIISNFARRLAHTEELSANFH